jgi:hypothetical protein
VLLSGDYGGPDLIGSRTVRPRSILENGCFEVQFSLFSGVLPGRNGLFRGISRGFCVWVPIDVLTRAGTRPAPTKTVSCRGDPLWSPSQSEDHSNPNNPNGCISVAWDEVPNHDQTLESPSPERHAKLPQRTRTRPPTRQHHQRHRTKTLEFTTSPLPRNPTNSRQQRVFVLAPQHLVSSKWDSAQQIQPHLDPRDRPSARSLCCPDLQTSPNGFLTLNRHLTGLGRCQNPEFD